jgi:carotenoid cleavage dioxygenase-like enzyme
MTLRRRDFLRLTAGAGWALASATDHLLADADPKKATPMSPFLEGNFGPIKEEVTADNLLVIGKLPPELDGMYVRNGPNPQFPPLRVYHWFDGDGMLHGVRIKDGKASYRNRYVQTDGWKEERKAGKALWGSIGEPPDPIKLLEGKGYKNTANTALVWHHGKLLALWEGGEPTIVKVPDLETLGLETFGGKLKHPFTAHPKIDTATGEMLFFGYQPIKPYVQFSVCDRDGKITRTMPIDIPKPVMMHDFAVTPRYAIFMDLPETFDFTRAFKGEPVLKFEPELGARFGVLPRDGKPGDIKWFEAKTCFVFHTLNAYEDDDEVVLLACRMKEYPTWLDKPEMLGDKAKPPAPVLYRWRFNLKTGKTQEEAVDDAGCEFPRLNEAILGRKARYGYVMTGGMDGLAKYDLEKGASELHKHGKDHFGGEGVFVPRPDGKGEDDGWLVTYVHDQAENKSEMVVIDARDFRSPPVARVLLPQRVPFGFHGTWIAGNLL